MNINSFYLPLFLTFSIGLFQIDFCQGQSLQPFVATANPNGTFESPTVLGTKLFYVSTSPTSGKELWVSDGTPDGCQLVKDIYTSTGSSNPHDLTVVGNTLFFWAADGINGDKLWMTNGTEAGTQMVTDQSPTGYAATNSRRVVGNRLVISTTSTNNQRYLFSVDPTGTVVKLSPVAQGNSALVNFNNRLLLFQSMDSLFLFNEVFTSKTLVKTGMRIYTPNLEPIGTTLGNKYVFTGSPTNNNFEPWVTDGTNAGTVQLLEINPTSSSFPATYFAFNGKIYFVNSSGPLGSELYSTDGTPGGTGLVKNINPQNGGAAGSGPSSFTPVGDSLYFLANDGFFGEELWVTTGTLESTRRLTDLILGTGSGNISSLTSYQGKLFFRNSYDTVMVRSNGVMTKIRVQNATGLGGLTLVGDRLLLQINYGFARIFPDYSIGRYTNNSINFTNNYFLFANRIFGLYNATKMFSIADEELVSVEPEIRNHPLILFPNPARDQLNIQTRGSDSYQHYFITDAIGRRVNQPQPLANDRSVEVAYLPAGMYWITLVGAHSSQTMKFVKN